MKGSNLLLSALLLVSTSAWTMPTVKEKVGNVFNSSAAVVQNAAQTAKTSVGTACGWVRDTATGAWQKLPNVRENVSAIAHSSKEKAARTLQSIRNLPGDLKAAVTIRNLKDQAAKLPVYAKAHPFKAALIVATPVIAACALWKLWNSQKAKAKA